MNAQTLAIIENLEKLQWFHGVGVRDTKEAVVLATWQEAIDRVVSADWEGELLDAANACRRRIAQVSKDRFNQWNDVVEQLKSVTIPLVSRQIDAVVRACDLPKKFEDIVQWDILHACIEVEYSDLVQPDFYARQAQWYVRGHFPCGWNGVYPEGIAVIF